MLQRIRGNAQRSRKEAMNLPFHDSTTSGAAILPDSPIDRKGCVFDALSCPHCQGMDSCYGACLSGDKLFLGRSVQDARTSKAKR